MSVLDKMRAKLADPNADHGGLCQFCHESALGCQVIFIESSEAHWCCRACAHAGPLEAHTDVFEPIDKKGEPDA